MSTGAGARNQLWTLERPARITNSVGEPIISWQVVGEEWVSVKPLTARETIRARAVEVQTGVTVRMLYRDDIRSDWRLTRVKDDGTLRVLHIIGIVDVDEAHIELDLACNEVTSG